MAESVDRQHQPTPTQILERLVHELGTLHEIARAVTSVLDLEAVLNRIVEAAVYLTSAEEGFLLLVDEETGDLTLRAGKGLGDKVARGMSMKVTDSIAGQVVKTGQPVRMGGFRRDEEYKVKTGYLVKSLVNVPIKSAGRVIGVLSVDHSVASLRTFSDHDVALLSSLADYAAIAIENARLFAKASAKADELAEALKEQTGVTPSVPSPEEDRRALEQFVQGLRGQREEVLQGADRVRDLAKELREQAESAEEIARGLGLWNEEVLGLLPQLEWLANAGLTQMVQPAAQAPAASSKVEADHLVVSSVSDSQFLEHLTEGVLVCDAKGRIHRANQAVAQILGRPLAELVNSDLQSLTDDPRWERMVGSLRLSLALGRSEQPVPPAPETTLYVNDHTIHTRLIPILESGSEAAIIVAIVRDISAETEGWRARNKVIATLSQKLRGPMTAVASYSGLLLGDTMGVGDSMQRRYLQRVRQGVEQIEAVLRELGDELSTPGRRTTPAAGLSVSHVINQAVEAARNVLSLDGVSIALDIGEDLPPVQIDADSVSRILTDLLAVAGKRTGVGDSVSVSTQVQTSDAQPSHLVIRVRNGGVTPQGVPPVEEDENIQSAQSMAEVEGGRIWLERQPDGSDMISFLIPIAEPTLSDHLL